MSNLENLAPEVFALIARFVRAGGSPLASLAATSRECQRHVEQITFRKLSASHSTFSKFNRIVNAKRFSALRILDYDIRGFLQSDDIVSNRKVGTIWVTEEDVLIQNRTFAAGFRQLLSMLKAKSKDCPDHPGLELSIEGCWGMGTDPYKALPPNVDKLDERNLKHAWARLKDSDLPPDLTVEVITRFYCTECIGFATADIWPASWLVLLGRFPNLRFAHVFPFERERKDLGGRRDARDAFAVALRSLPSTLQHLMLVCESASPFNHFVEPPSLMTEDNGYDMLSRELGILSMRLNHLEIQGAVLNLTDFFRSIDHPSSQRHLELTSLEVASPDGTWSFMLDPDIPDHEFREEHIDEYEESPTWGELREEVRIGMRSENRLPRVMDVVHDPLRSTMIPSKFNELYVAVAHAVKHMPYLQRLEIVFQIRGECSDYYNGEHEFRFYRNLKSNSWDWPSSANMQAGWGTRPQMTTIDESVRHAWRELETSEGEAIDLLLGKGDFYNNLTIIR